MNKIENEIQDYIKISTYNRSKMAIPIMDNQLLPNLSIALHQGNNKVKVLTFNRVIRKIKAQHPAVNNKQAVNAFLILARLSQ